MRPQPEQQAERTRGRVALVLAVTFGLLLLGVGVNASPGGATGTIAVQQTSVAYVGACVPTWQGRASWSYRTENTTDYFRLTVQNPTTLCDGVDAVAAVYTMPSNNVAWPQRLAATERFTIREASTTVITFTKDCQPAQFDVVTGATPEVIDILGPYHGQLLFPGDIATAFQYQGPGCTTATTTSVPPTTSPTSTTSTSTTSTSTTSTSSTTTPTPSVEGASTDRTPPEVAALIGSSNTPSDPEPEVLGATTSRGAGNSLALTGTEVSLLLGAGLALLVAGGIITAARRHWGVRTPKPRAGRLS